MQNPLPYLGSLLGKSPTGLASVLPALEEPLILTWLKRDLAEMTADAFHEDLLRLRGSDAQAFKRTLALYAGWAQYVTALNNQLDHMNGGPHSIGFSGGPLSLEDEGQLTP